MVADYATTGLTLGAHPVELLRPELPAEAVTTRDLETLRHDTPVTIGGLVVARQRPGTAKGIVFLLLEDEFGTINLIVPPDVYERHRLAVRTEPLLLARGRLEKLPMAGGALNVYVRDLRPLSAPDAARRRGRRAARARRSRAPPRPPAERRGGAAATARWPTSAASRRRCRASRPGGADDGALPRRHAAGNG